MVRSAVAVEFLQKFDEIQLTAKPDVVMYTSSDDPRDMEKAARFEKVAGFMTKPFELQKLQTILDRLDEEGNEAIVH